ncbi:MAG TPA: capsule assembly Wzi family protein, partial [Gemmatimonadaceae bacterium]|nr:capsule assembly Wzi family protein [Gemmatimonadaceae bacterium]
ATRLIDPLDPAYRELQLLVDAGLVGRLSLVQRPLSRAAFARAVDDASKNLARRTPPGLPALAGDPQDVRASFFRELIRSLRNRLDLPDSMAGLVPVVAPIRSVGVDVTGTNQPTRQIPLTNGLGSIDGTLNTLLLNREGRPLVHGTSAIVESNHTFESPHVAFEATPQFSFASPSDSASRTRLRLQTGELRILVRNVALDVGREYVVWGQGRDVGMLNSNNSPPLDEIRISNEQPFFFPWVLRRLGPTRLTLFYADLGADQNFPHAYAIAYRGSIVPSDYLELGASVYTKAGGKGAPPATTTARLIDLLPFLDASAYNNVFGTRGNFMFSDHYAGFDGRLRLPSVGTTFYWEVLLNDFDVRRLGSVFWDDAGHVFGFDLPPLSPSGRLTASLEYHHTGLRYYEHEQFLSGQTVHETLTGDPLGPNAQGVYANFDWYESLQRRLGIQLALERRSNDQYAFIPEPHFGFTIKEHRPKEWTGRALASWQLLPERAQLGALVQFGYERTRNFDFAAADNRNGLLGRFALQYRFR